MVWPITCVPFRIVNVSVPSLMATPARVLTVALKFRIWLDVLKVVVAGVATVPLAPLTNGWYTMVGRLPGELSLWSRILASICRRRRGPPVVAGEIDRRIGITGRDDAVIADAGEVVSGDAGLRLSAGVGRAIDRELS